jgi:TldD protein
MVFIREDKTFANTEGAFVEQTIIESGAGIEATAVAEGEIQRRSYPNTFARQQVTGGYEEIEAWALVEQAERIAEEAVELLSADVAPEGTFDIVLGPTQLALQVHESCGHPIELDRVFGTEAAYAGTSFLTPEKLGTFRYGSEVVNIVADATTPKGLGTFGWDDEGVPAQRVDIIKDGLFVGYLTSRESAMRLHELNPAAPAISNGTMRASAWNRIPLIRMTNINILPGSWEFDDLVADTDRGLYLEMNRSWSIDDRRLNFQFGTEIAREIKGGKLGKLYKNAVYTGITPEFWGRCDAVCNERHWSIWGTPNCGKGQPSQLAHVGHGAAPARFRGVRVFGVR